ncbi:hypothetical protein Hanom_Chr12g01103831 [Helianthus anomalus]
MFIQNFKDCLLFLKVMRFVVLYIYKSCVLCLLTLTKLSFFIKLSHMRVF